MLVRLVFAGVAVAGCTFAKADFAHTFMGSKKYSAYVLTQQTDKLSQLSAFSSGISLDTDENNYATALAMALKDIIPSEGLEIEISGDLNLKDDSIDEFANNLNCDIEQAEMLLKAIKDCSAKLGIKFTEDGIIGSTSLVENGSDLLKAVIYYDSDTEAYYFTIPGVVDESFMMASDEMIIDLEALNSDAKEDNEAAQMFTDVINAYKDSLDDAEITYEKGTFEIGDVEFKGRINTVTFKGDALAEMIENVGEEFLDSDFAESYDIYFDIDDLVDEFEDCKSVQLVIQNFINGNNTSAGMNIELTVKTESSMKGTAQLGYLNCKDGIAVTYDISDSTSFVLSQDIESKTSGKYTVKYNNGYSDKKFTISYENANTKKMFDKNIQLGEYSMKVSDSSDKLNVVLTDDDNKLNCTVTLKTEDGTYTTVIKLAEGFSDEFDTSNISSAIDVDDDEAMNEVNVKFIQNLADKSENSTLCTSIPYNNGTFAEYVRSEAIKAQRNLELKENYSDYDETTIKYACNAANELYYAAKSVSYNLSSLSEQKIKLYFDANGKVSLIDDAGVSNANVIVEKFSGYSYKNAYVEVVLWNGRGPVCGVNVVMTDDKSNLPDTLPTAYSFLDKEYNWGSNDDQYYSGSFVTGTFPRISNGEGGKTKENDEKLLENVKTYNIEAEKAAESFEAYTGLKFGDGKGYITFKISNGKWSLASRGGISISGTQSDLENYMTTSVGTINSQYVSIFIKNGSVIGATASDYNMYLYFAVEDFEIGKSDEWTYANGVINGSAVGTYPVLTNSTELPKMYIDEMIGTWKARYTGDSVTITNEFLENCVSYSTSRATGKVNMITLNFKDGTKLMYYRNNTPYIYFNNNYTSLYKE